MNLLSWLDDKASSGGSRAPGSQAGRGVYLPDRMGRLDRGIWKKPETLPDPFGWLPGAERGVVSPGLDALLKDGITLSRPVGATGDNRPGDVAKVENLLGAAGHLDLDATDGPTGYFGGRVEDAVKGFQKDLGLKVDGKLNPGGETIHELGSLGQTIGYPQTGGKPPRGPDAGTGSREGKSGEAQVAFAQAIPLIDALLAAGAAVTGGAIAQQPLGKQKGNPGTPSTEGPTSVSPEMLGLSAGAMLPGYLQRLARGDAGKGDSPHRTGEAPSSLLETFPAVEPERPGRMETPIEDPRKPEIETFPARPGDLPTRIENPIPETGKPEVETFPDRSGEFDGFNVQEIKPIDPIDWGAGGSPHSSTQAKLDSIEDARFHEALRRHFLHNGVQDKADDDATNIKIGRPASEGEWEFEHLVHALGKDPAEVEVRYNDNSEPYRVYEDPRDSYSIVWREFSSKDNPTLEVQLKGLGRKGRAFLLKKRYNPR